MNKHCTLSLLWSEQLRKLESNLTKTVHGISLWNLLMVCGWPQCWRIQIPEYTTMFIDIHFTQAHLWRKLTIYGQDLQPKHLVHTTACWFTCIQVLLVDMSYLTYWWFPVFTIRVRVLRNSELFSEEQHCLVSIHSGMVKLLLLKCAYIRKTEKICIQIY